MPRTSSGNWKYKFVLYINCVSIVCISTVIVSCFDYFLMTLTFRAVTILTAGETVFIGTAKYQVFIIFRIWMTSGTGCSVPVLIFLRLVIVINLTVVIGGILPTRMYDSAPSIKIQ